MKWHNCIITWVLGLTAYFSIEFGSISVRISKVNRLDWITSIYYSNPSLMHHHPSIHLTLVPKPTSTLHWFIENNNSGLVIPKLENSEVFQNSTRSVLSLLTYWLHKSYGLLLQKCYILKQVNYSPNKPEPNRVSAKQWIIK